MLETLKKPMEHYGPVNNNFLRKINPKDMFIQVYQSIVNAGAKILKLDNYKLECDLKGKKFQIEVMQLDVFKNYSIMRFFKGKLSTSDALKL